MLFQFPPCDRLDCLPFVRHRPPPGRAGGKLLAGPNAQGPGEKDLKISFVFTVVLKNPTEISMTIYYSSIEIFRKSPSYGKFVDTHYIFLCVARHETARAKPKFNGGFTAPNNYRYRLISTHDKFIKKSRARPPGLTPIPN